MLQFLAFSEQLRDFSDFLPHRSLSGIHEHDEGMRVGEMNVQVERQRSAAVYARWYDACSRMKKPNVVDLSLSICELLCHPTLYVRRQTEATGAWQGTRGG